MFKIDDNNNIHITRGDAATIKIESEEEIFESGDSLILSIVKKGNYNEIEFQKTVSLQDGASATIAEIPLTSAETKSFCSLFKNGKKEFWYEIQLDHDDAISTLVGCDSDGSKSFIIYPEAEEQGSI